MTIASKPLRFWPILAIMLLGLLLRLLAARGDYWLDEAWSALFARDAATPGRVFFAINHDNNHHLNTLWLQLVGWGATPMLGRALSIACGTATIAVAALIGARHGRRSAIVAALLFAVSPILVTYGSEARGYAPMLLALMASIWIVDRDLNGVPVRHAPIWLGVAALIGMLAHGAMLFGVAALTLWVAFRQRRRVLPLLGRALLAVAAVLAMIMLGALSSPEGFRIGSLAAFSYPAFLDALAYMIAFTLGWPFVVGPWLAAILALSIAAIRLRDRAPFLLIAILGLPLAVAILQPDNSAFPRYYLLSAVALLLLLSDLLARPRWYALLPLGALLAGSLALDARLIDNRRAQPGLAVEAMARHAPAGAIVLAGAPRDRAVLEAAAATRGYQLRVEDGCADARFLFAQNNGTVSFPPAVARCGFAFRTILTGHGDGLSAMDWRLYEKAR